MDNKPINSYSNVGKPDDYLVWAILSTVLCCLPFGIAAIVYSTKVDKLLERGDSVGANDASKKARMWMLIAVGCGVLSIIVGIVLMALGVFGAMMDEYL